MLRGDEGLGEVGKVIFLSIIMAIVIESVSLIFLVGSHWMRAQHERFNAPPASATKSRDI